MNYLMLFHAAVSNYSSFLQCVLWTTGCGDGEMDGLEPSRLGLTYIRTHFTRRGNQILQVVNSVLAGRGRIIINKGMVGVRFA